MEVLHLKTEKHELHDLTAQVREIVARSGVKDGICLVYTPHSTAGIVIACGIDPNVLTNAQQTFPIENGELMLGGSQEIYFFEFDGPRDRKVYVQVVGA